LSEASRKELGRRSLVSKFESGFTSPEHPKMREEKSVPAPSRILDPLGLIETDFRG
jgi:hypothetical protein